MINLNDIIKETVLLPVSYLLDPSRRIYLGYIFSSILIGTLFYYFKHKRHFLDCFKLVFCTKNWLSKSSFVDYTLFILGLLFKRFLIVPYLFLGTYCSFLLSELMTNIFGEINNSNISNYYIALSYPVILFFVKDFFVFITHYFLHKNKFLWEFHKVHHSATSLNFFTLYRMHPLEILLQNLQGLVAFILVTGIYFYFNNSIVAKATVFGVNTFNFIFFIFGANLRHSNIPLSYPKWIEKIFISPYQHQIHHGNLPQQCHSNFGSRLAIWDYIFGTLTFSEKYPVEKLSFGLPEKQNIMFSNTVYGNMASPFFKIFCMIKRKK